MKSKFPPKQVVNKAIHAKLPKAGFGIRFNGFWVRWKWEHWRGKARIAPHWTMRTRGSNFVTLWYGPLEITMPQRWLENPARQYHPGAFK